MIASSYLGNKEIIIITAHVIKKTEQLNLPL